MHGNSENLLLGSAEGHPHNPHNSLFGLNCASFPRLIACWTGPSQLHILMEESPQALTKPSGFMEESIHTDVGKNQREPLIEGSAWMSRGLSLGSWS